MYRNACTIVALLQISVYTTYYTLLTFIYYTYIFYTMAQNSTYTPKENQSKLAPAPADTPKQLTGVAQTMRIIGGKWKMVILAQLREEPRRFSSLQRAVPGITQRMLTLQLRELEADGLVVRTVYRQVPPRVDYALTPLGQSLLPVLNEMQWWGDAYATRAGRHNRTP